MEMQKEFYKILLIEDSSYDAFLVQKILAKQLGHSKFSITHSPLYKMAIDILKSNTFDFILSDLSLPDGYHAYKNIKIIIQYSKKTPIAVMSGFLDNNLKEDLLELGVIDYFEKGELMNQNLGELIIKEIKKYRDQIQIDEQLKNGEKRIILFDPKDQLKEVFEMIFYNEQSKIRKKFVCEIVFLQDKANILSKVREDQFALLFVDIDFLDLDFFIQNPIQYHVINDQRYPKIIALGTQEIAADILNKNGYETLYIKPFNNIQSMMSSILKLLS